MRAHASLALAALALPAAAQGVAGSFRPGAATAGVRTAFVPPDRFATSIVQLVQGTGTGVFVPSNLLGGPRGGGAGAGSAHVYSLGAGGSATLGFDVTIVDGPGADLTVFENGFASAGGVFAEVCLVEVSTDGAIFARFPTSYDGPPGPLPPFGTVPIGSYSGLAGGLPVIANVASGAADPFDPVVSGGESFDLAELADDPLVLSGLVDLDAIHFVRLVDVVEGTVLDSNGVAIWDVGAPGSADMDAVAVIQHAGNQTPLGPTVDLYLDAAQVLHLVVHDPNGLTDIAPADLRASWDLVAVPFDTLRATTFVTLLEDATTLHLVTPTPIPGSGLRGALSVSARDRGGAFAGDQVLLQG